LVDADITPHPIFRSGRFWGEGKFSPALGVDLSDVGEQLGKLLSNTLIAELEKGGDGGVFLAAGYTFSLL